MSITYIHSRNECKTKRRSQYTLAINENEVVTNHSPITIYTLFESVQTTPRRVVRTSNQVMKDKIHHSVTAYVHT